MNDDAKITIRSTRLGYYTLALAVAWTFVVSASLFWNIVQERRHTRWELATREARTHFNRDQAFRLWAASHGGVYVPTDERTPPNQHLAHVPNRDITTASGKKLTLMNPAYMLRQLQEEFVGPRQVFGHITSLKSLRLENKPDSWEQSALNSFERGAKEVVEFSVINGEPYLRLIRPMITKKGCLKCHSIQGYKEGDIRGGVSVSVPLTAYLAQERQEVFRITLTHILFGLMGLGGIAIGFRGLKRAEKALLKSEKELRLLSSQLLTAQEDERGRIARELHDSISQSLSAIKFKIEEVFGHAEQEIAATPSDACSILVPMVQTTIEEVRRIYMDLRPSVLDDLGLIATISWFSREFQEIYPGISIDREISIEEKEVPRPLKIVIYRILQEAMNNVAKHSEADRVHLSLTKTDSTIEVAIKDNGIGFDLEKALSTKDSERGFGLGSMRERIELSGGSLSIETSKGAGTVVRATWPSQVVSFA